MGGTSGRLLSLLSLLQARRDWPGHLLAHRLEVSERTVRRDVDRLRELGYPVEATMGPDGGYRLGAGAGADLPPLLFDDEQAVALAVALQLAASTGAGIADAAWRALGTVRQVMPGRLRRRVDAVQVLAMPRRGAADVAPAVLLAVTDAARAHQQLRFDYAAVGADAVTDGPPRRVEPHHVLNRGGRWYLLAWDLDREDWRTFRIDRMTPRTPTGPRFVEREVPGGDVGAYVAARFRGADPAAGGRWPCQGTVILHAPASDVVPYAEGDTVEPLGPDRCRLTTGAWSWAGLAASIARADAEIEVVEPRELAEAFGDLARRAARAADR